VVDDLSIIQGGRRYPFIADSEKAVIWAAMARRDSAFSGQSGHSNLMTGRACM
jgi:hypothetical protein